MKRNNKSTKKNSTRKWIKRAFWLMLFLFVLMNTMAMFHAYKFTHFSDELKTKKVDPKKLSTGQKISALFFGVNNPRPTNDTTPDRDYTTICLKSNKKIECWEMKVAHPKGTIILFHGYSGNKSSMLDKSDVFNRLGYNTLLVDFMGSGGSEGNQTTIGFYEAKEVTTCFHYLDKQEKNIFLFGTSMGAVAIMKAIRDDHIRPKGIVLECPFGSLYKTVCARFKAMNAPTFPMVGLLVFWGGIENDFPAFDHNPTEYAKSINCPTLLLYGAKDERVSREETREIYHNLKGKKKLIIYPRAGHENYLNDYKTEWTNDMQMFLTSENN